MTNSQSGNAPEVSSLVIQGPKLDPSKAMLWLLPQLAVPPTVSILLETTNTLDAGVLPWTSRYGMWAALLAYMIGAPLLLSIAQRWWHLPRTGSAELNSEGVQVTKHGTPKRSLPWAEIRGFSSNQEAYLQLHRKGEPRPTRFWTLPTPNEATRTKVMASLDERGVEQL